MMKFSFEIYFNTQVEVNTVKNIGDHCSVNLFIQTNVGGVYSTLYRGDLYIYSKNSRTIFMQFIHFDSDKM